jgi:hypothetical protein
MSRPTDEGIMNYWHEIGKTSVSPTVDTVRYFMEWAGKHTPQPEGVMSFEEWDEKGTASLTDNWSELSITKKWKHIWNAARQGMIPAASAIQIPLESEWPGKAKAIVIAFSELDYLEIERECPMLIKAIPRSKPQWKPEIGKPVFAWDSDASTNFEIVILKDSGCNNGWYDTNDNHWIHVAKLKSLDDIGHSIAWFKENKSLV